MSTELRRVRPSEQAKATACKPAPGRRAYPASPRLRDRKPAAPPETLDPVNSPIAAILKNHGLARFGVHANKQWFEDPRHLLFSMSRYKFVAKMLSGCRKVLEVGGGDGFNARLVLQEVGSLLITDADPWFIKWAESLRTDAWYFSTRVHDILDGPVDGTYDGIYSLDVIEHIPPAHEPTYLTNMCSSLSATGILIIGTPSKESQVYSRPPDVSGHINCKAAPELKASLLNYFNTVFMFSMNDELVHTGHYKMAQYLLAVCCGKKKQLPKHQGSGATRGVPAGRANNPNGG